MKLRNVVRRFSVPVGGALAAVPGLSFAQVVAPDITAATGVLSATETNLVAVGVILISLAAVAVGLKWVKGMIFS